ncbi:hypothetical protein [uncultured Paraglaciecola sp.]|uniref:hypothetical protein n=1 Tax=uncultured Paraglaciecola sp. TaxID=1765024 RepID=UPI00261F3AA5|nr:hypothetical protein [uncultured Paraglaciecola sp.]
MSITPGYKSKARFMQVGIKRPADAKGIDYIAEGVTPLAIQTNGLTTTSWESEQISRDLDNGKNGAQPVIHTGEMISVSGAVEMAGSGSANTPAAWSPLMEMSGYDINTSTATEVSHNRILTAEDELDGTIYFRWQGMYHILLAGKVTLGTSAKIGEIGKINFEAKGVYGGTLEGAMPNGDFSAFVQPVQLSTANTSFSLDGQLLNMFEFEMAQNNAIEIDEGTELKQVFISDWAEEGKVIIEQPALSTFDPFAIARVNTLLPFEFTHGLTTGNIFKQSSTGVQIMSVDPGEHKGKATWELGLRVITGHDSIITTL